MEPIELNGETTLSLRQIDELNGFRKGTAFRVFKHAGQNLKEGVDYHYLPQSQHRHYIEQLSRAGHIYASTTHLVLITRSGYNKLKTTLASGSP